MGCGSGQKQVVAPVRLRTVTGKLKITLTNAVLFHEVSMFKMDPYVILKLSNQTFTSKVAEDGDKNPNFSESFSFFINSCYQVHGRHLEVTLMDKKKVGSDAEIGFGIVDLDPVVNYKKPKDQFRCFINFNRKQAGLINIVAEFVEETAQTLNIRFETASIRRRTSYGDMNCWIQATIGEESLETSRQKDTKQMPPVWSKDILVFNVPKSAQHCEIVVMDNDNQVGRVKVEIGKLISSSSEQAFNEKFEFENEVNAGTITFQTLTGTNPAFSEIKTVHRKIKQEPKNEEKKDEKKGEENKDNKEEKDKKDENKAANPQEKAQPKKQEIKQDNKQPTKEVKA